MKYKITFNNPGSSSPMEVTVSGEEMEKLITPDRNGATVLSEKGKIIRLNGSFFNTSYFVKAVPDTEGNRLEESQKRMNLELEGPKKPEEIAQREVINDLKFNILKKIR